MIKDHVQCHSGYKYAEEPRVIHWDGEKLQVDWIKSSWRTPEGSRFVVRVEDGRMFDLTYDEGSDEWSITLT